jgi:hypothetical protein
LSGDLWIECEVGVGNRRKRSLRRFEVMLEIMFESDAFKVNKHEPLWILIYFKLENHSTRSLVISCLLSRSNLVLCRG